LQNTAGRLVYWSFESSRTYFIVLLCDGGKYGCDGLEFFRYNGDAVPEFDAGHEDDELYRNWRFHPGTLTAQVVMKTYTADNGTDTFTSTAHGYANDTAVRTKSIGGALPPEIPADTKLYIVNQTANTFQLSLTSGGAAITFADNGTGTLKVWKADAGFDDPVQGRPQFFSWLNLTFSGMCYVEGRLPAALSADAEPSGFQFGLRARKIADFDTDGTYLSNSFSANNARVYADIVLNVLKRPDTRINWASWSTFRDACDVMIWDRIDATDDSVPGTGFSSRWYNTTDWTGAAIAEPMPTIDFTDLLAGGRPAGINSTNFSFRAEARLKPEYSEIYTFKASGVDDGVRVYVNNELIIDKLTTLGTHTGTISLTADTLVNIVVEFHQFTGPAAIRLYWSSASQAEQIIPETALYASDAEVKRFEANVAFGTATQAGAGLDEVMKRAPGWHSQDVNGMIKFLPPDREIVHHFLYDPAVTDERFNIAAKTFEANPRNADERPNFRIHYFNDKSVDTLDERWTEGDREELRENQGGLPSDVAPARWGVMSRSQADRQAEMEMVLFSDPDRSFTLRGQTDSYHVSVGDRVNLTHIATGETFAAPVEAIVTAEGFGAGKADEKAYTLLPVAFPLALDEEVVEE
jgi:hypothetical protein